MMQKAHWVPTERGMSSKRHCIPCYGGNGRTGEELHWIDSDHIQGTLWQPQSQYDARQRLIGGIFLPKLAKKVVFGTLAWTGTLCGTDFNRPSVPRKFWISSLLVILWKTYFQSRKESRTCAHRRVHVRVSFWLCFPLLRYCRTGCGLFRPKIGPLRHGAQACQPSSPQAPCGSSVRPFCIVPEAAMDEAF